MHVLYQPIRNLCLLMIILLSGIGSQSQACVREKANQAMERSNMRQIAFAFAVTIHENPDTQFNPDRTQTMEDFLLLMARVQLIDSSVFFNYTEFQEFESTPPRIIGQYPKEGEAPALHPEILKYPIGFSVAVYPKPLELPASMTPLLWSRDLHLFREFNAPYCGFVAYLDGHVEFYEGTPDKPDPELLELFSETAPSADAVRILKHIPNGWTEAAPLPVRFAFMTKETFVEKHSLIIFISIPAIICGLLARIFSNRNRSRSQRILAGVAVFLIVLFLAAILVPTVGC